MATTARKHRSFSFSLTRAPPFLTSTRSSQRHWRLPTRSLPRRQACPSESRRSCPRGAEPFRQPSRLIPFFPWCAKLSLTLPAGPRSLFRALPRTQKGGERGAEEESERSGAAASGSAPFLEKRRRKEIVSRRRAVEFSFSSKQNREPSVNVGNVKKKKLAIFPLVAPLPRLCCHWLHRRPRHVAQALPSLLAERARVNIRRRKKKRQHPHRKPWSSKHCR